MNNKRDGWVKEREGAREKKRNLEMTVIWYGQIDNLMSARRGGTRYIFH